MLTKRKMESMSNEELKVIAMKKNAKRVATREALLAQEVLWERLYHITDRTVDDYEGGS